MESALLCIFVPEKEEEQPAHAKESGESND
jgi:hypothetical protein